MSYKTLIETLRDSIFKSLLSFILIFIKIIMDISGLAYEQGINQLRRFDDSPGLS